MEIRLALQDALLGEVYPSIRAVVYKHNPIRKHFTLRFYLDREPDEVDFENIGLVATGFLSHFKFSDFDKVEEECIFNSDQPSKLDIMDGIVYRRRESWE